MVSRITVLGTGYLGTTHAAGLAEMGFEVLGVDTDPARIDALTCGELPFYEPGLESLLQSGLKSGRLSFTSSYPEAAAYGDVHFICVGTPQLKDSYGADLSQVEGCVDALGPLLAGRAWWSASPPCRWAPRSCWPAGCPASRRPAVPASSPGIPSSCGKGTPSRTRCGRTGSWPG